jgi:hypothetical protein
MTLERRNQYGFPCLSPTEMVMSYGYPIPGNLDHVDPLEPISGSDDDCEPETWAEELPEDEAASLRAIQDRVVNAMRGYLSDADCEWAVEETLWQMVMILRRKGTLHLPEIGRLEVVDIEPGPALIAVASPLLSSRGAEAWL